MSIMATTSIANEMLRALARSASPPILNRLAERLQHCGDDVLVNEVLADLALDAVALVERLADLACPVLAHREEDGDRRLREIVGADLVSVLARLDVEPALQAAGVVEGEHQRRFVAEDLG